MRTTQKFLLTSALALGLQASASAVTFVFFTGSEPGDAASGFDDAEFAGSFTDGGIEISGEAFLAGVSAGTTFNATTSSFGINAAGTGDDTDQIDGVNGIESAVFSFDQNVVLTELDLRSITSGGSDIVSVSISGGGSTLLLGSSDFDNNTSDIIALSESITIGQTLTLAFSAGNGFSIDSITVESAVVPEASHFALLIGGISGAFLVYRRKKNKS